MLGREAANNHLVLRSAGLLPSGLTEMQEPGARIGNGRVPFKTNEPRLALRDEPLVAEQKGSTFAKPGLELRVEGEGVKK